MEKSVFLILLFKVDMTAKKYTTALSKAQGMIDETFALFSIWKPGMSTQQLASLAIEEGVLSKATAKRVRDIVAEQFAPRYLVNGAQAAKQIKILFGAGASITELKQILLIHTARANAVLYDYICETYWPKYQAGRETISKDDAIQFLESAVNIGRLPERWSDTMMNRVASYLGGCLADFGLVEAGRKSTRKILQFKIDRLTSLYLAHEAHFSGYNDSGIIAHSDWRLFGLEGIDVVRELQRVSNDHFILQYSGDLIRFSWNYKSIEEALRGIAAEEL
jgi:BrxA